MVAHTWRRARNLAWAILLAVGLAVLLLVAADRAASAVSAASPDERLPSSEALASDEISVTWTSNESVFTVVSKSLQVWPCTPHPVTITFLPSAVQSPSWFTFTPRSESVLPGNTLATPYFFDVYGTYIESGGEVSLWKADIQIELAYDKSRLGEIEPQSLRFYHLGATEWVTQDTDVDLLNSTVSLEIRRTGSFGVGGDPPQLYLYLPFVRHD
jgi:hypothetical protein